MREASNADERMSERGNLHEQGSSAHIAHSAFCAGISSLPFFVRCEAGSEIYNKFVANVFLPENKNTRETELIRLATRTKPVYSAREDSERIRNENAISTEK